MVEERGNPGTDPGWLQDTIRGIAQEQGETRKVINHIQRDVADLRVEVERNFVGRADCHDRHASLETMVAKELARKQERGPLEAGWKTAGIIVGGLMGWLAIMLTAWKLFGG